MGKSKIEWTEKTWNPVLGCSKVSEGCRNCYAMSMSARIANAARDREDPTAIQQGYMKVVKQDENGKYLPKWTNDIAIIPERLEDPLNWQKPSMVFVNSMSDLFHPDVPYWFIDQVFTTMALADIHIFQVLTKRPERMADYLSGFQSRIPMNESVEWPLPNVWLGTSVENQEAADKRIPYLLECPSAVRFLSCEPLLGPVDLFNVRVPAYGFQYHSLNVLDGVARSRSEIGEMRTESFGKVDWIIAGGESGLNARPMHPDWAKSLRDQCQEAGTAFFFKQWGAWMVTTNGSSPEDEFTVVGRDGEMTSPDDYFKNPGAYQGEACMVKVGKKTTGRQLDGQEYNQMPI